MRAQRNRRALRTWALALVLLGASCATPRSQAPGQGADPTAGVPRLQRARDGDCDDTGACAGPSYVVEGRSYWVSCGPVPPEWLGGPLVAVGLLDVPFDEVRAVPELAPTAWLVARQRDRFGPCEGEAGRWTVLYAPGVARPGDVARVGVAFPYDFPLHCGMEFVAGVAGRNWATDAAPYDGSGPAPEAWRSAYRDPGEVVSPLLAGELELVGPDVLEFRVVGLGLAVRYEPTAEPIPGCA